MLKSLHWAPGISLRELLPSAELSGADDIRVTSCSGDSRSCRPGDLFVALVGANQDGHDYARAAMARGAAAVLAERMLPIDGLPICIVPDTRKAHGQLCQALAGNPSQRLKVIGVTGTNGKTTTSHLIASVLAAAEQPCGMLGTLGYFDGIEAGPAELTTPAAPELANWLARMQANGCSHAVMEVSSHALSQSRVAGIEFDVACITNIRRDHLDYHGTLANYRRAKARLFEHLREESLVVVNADDPVSMNLTGRLNHPVLTIGIENPAEVTATVLERHSSEQTFLLSAGNDSVPVRTSMIGDHHVYNCLTAAAVGLGYGIDLTTIVRGLELAGHVPGRLERIECGQPFGVFVDYAHTPHALSVALDTLRQVTPGRLICVFGAGGDRDTRKRPLMGSSVEARADVCIVTDDNPRSEDPADIAKNILMGFDNPANARLVPDRRQAIQEAITMARPGDCVLLAGKGHEQFQIIGRQRLPLDDRDIARRHLYQMASENPRLWGERLPVTRCNS